MINVKQFIYQLKNVEIESDPDANGTILLNNDDSINLYANKRVVISAFGQTDLETGIKIRLNKKIVNPLNYYLLVSNHEDSELARFGIFIPQYFIELQSKMWKELTIPFINPTQKTLTLGNGGLVGKAVLMNYNIPKIKQKMT